MRFSSKTLFGTLSVLAFAQACSLLNAYDDLLDASPGVETPGSDASSGSDSGNDGASQSDGNGSSDGGPRGPGGALVVAGEVADDGGKSFVVSVLDPTTGREVDVTKREAKNVVGVQYDGLRDLWYLFQSSGTTAPPAPADSITLHVRELDPRTATWTEKGSVAVPTPVSNDLIGMLRNMIVYVAYASVDGGGLAYQLVTLNTSDPAAPTVATSSPTLALSPNGIMTARSNSANGGTVNLVSIDTSQCDSDAGNALCAAVLTRGTVTTAAISLNPTTVQIGSIQKDATLGVGVQLTGPEHLVAFPATADAGAQIKRLNPANGAGLGAPLPLAATELRLRHLAVSECFNTAFATSIPSSQQIFAVPLGGGTATTGVLSHAGQRVLFEPFTASVVSPFKAGSSNFAITAFSVTGSPSAPVLTKRTTNWEPPTDLQPNVVGVRQPIPFACP